MVKSGKYYARLKRLRMVAHASPEHSLKVGLSMPKDGVGVAIGASLRRVADPTAIAIFAIYRTTRLLCHGGKAVEVNRRTHAFCAF